MAIGLVIIDKRIITDELIFTIIVIAKMYWSKFGLAPIIFMLQLEIKS